MISPKVINVEKALNTDHFPESTILSNLNLTELPTSIEMGIYHNLYNECGTNLLYKINDKSNSRKIFVDAETGQVIKEISSILGIMAPVERYGDSNGMVDLDDRTFNGTTELISNDGQINTHDFGGVVFPDDFQDLSVNDFSVNQIPTTSNSVWTLNESIDDVYQAHFVIQDLIPVFSDHIMDFDRFDRINVAANMIGGNDNGAYAAAHLEDNEGYIWFGSRPNGTSCAIFDIGAHELGHIVSNELGLDYATNQSLTLNEMMSDIYSVYIMYKKTGILDWIIGEEIGGFGIRDMSTLESCIINTTYLSLAQTNQVVYSVADNLHYIFYLLVEGGYGIEPIEIETVMDLFMETSANVGENPTILEFLNGMLEIATNTLDPCQLISIKNAWDEVICEYAPNTNTQNANAAFVMLSDRINEIKGENCHITLKGPDFVCEEHQSLSIFIDGGVSGSFFDWRIIGNNSTGFGTYNGSLQGNSQTGGNSLELNKFPKFPYYPQTITIQVYDYGTKRKIEKKVTIIDCDGLDPDCETYYSLDGQVINDSTLETKIERIIQTIQVFDLSGKKVFEGTINSTLSIDYNGLLIFTYYDKTNNHVKSEVKYYSNSNILNR